ncbi:MAG: transposase [Desulfatirhabdiaceae bacterium]
MSGPRSPGYKGQKLSAKFKRYWIPNSIAFLTVVTAHRKPLFKDHSAVIMAKDVLRRVKEIHPFEMKGYTILPDHMHLMIHTSDGRFDHVIQSFKRNLSIEFHRCGIVLDRDIWLKRFYDHVIRDDDDFKNHLDYIHFNPVHHGITLRPMDHPFSSFRHYVKIGWYDVGWGDMVPRNIDGMKLD